MNRRTFALGGMLLSSQAFAQQKREARKSYRKDQIAPRVKQVTVEQLKVDKSKVTDQARFIEDLGADSLDVVELLMAIEGAFEVAIADSEIEKMIRVSDVVALVERRLRATKRLIE